MEPTAATQAYDRWAEESRERRRAKVLDRTHRLAQHAERQRLRLRLLLARSM